MRTMVASAAPSSAHYCRLFWHAIDLANRVIRIFLPVLNAAMAEFGITTPARQAAFLSQVGHESC